MPHPSSKQRAMRDNWAFSRGAVGIATWLSGFFARQGRGVDQLAPLGAHVDPTGFHAFAGGEQGHAVPSGWGVAGGGGGRAVVEAEGVAAVEPGRDARRGVEPLLEGGGLAGRKLEVAHQRGARNRI